MKRRLLAPEIVQTSSMDCGPAALACLLTGHGIAASYGRLREACQTSVDGTSIDTVEAVANDLGLIAEQVMIPVDHVALGDASLPAIVVVRHADEATHFVVVWRRHGGWVQVMDPAIGRRWLRLDRFRESMFHHRLRVDVADWFDWAGGAENAAALRARCAAIGIDEAGADPLIAAALAGGWRAAATFDAALRLVAALVAAGGVSRGGDTARLLAALASGEAGDPRETIPERYWSAARASDDPDAIDLAGAVLVRIAGVRTGRDADAPALAPELAAALAEPPARPLRRLFGIMREDGLVAPLAVALAAALAAGVLLLETMLLRGLLDVAGRLALPVDRLTAGLALVVFMGALVAAELTIAREALRQGRALELRLRMALLAKLPRLADRYFQSRPISDMADRSHNIHVLRGLAGLGIGLVGALCELVFTTLAIGLVAPSSALPAIGLATVALVLPFLAQPLLAERDLRVRNHAGALNGFYLDALLGLSPIRAHRAQDAVTQQHEGLLVDWAHAMRSFAAMAVAVEGVQALLGTALAIGVILGHFAEAGSVGGADLLFVFWVLKLPALGGRIAAATERYPAQRNVFLRIAEPLDAPEEEDNDDAPPRPTPAGPAAIAMDRVDVVAGGHPILSDVTLTIAPGEHVAIVGASGAGKSSLIGLLLGWHRPASGALAIDGLPLDGGALRALRRRTAWVDPAIQLWNRSLADNLLYAQDEPRLVRIGHVMRAARLRGVAQHLPEGLQSLLGEGGGLVSGGEGQRIRLGRALAMDAPRLVLLDEPFRGLDRGQRATLLGEARTWWREATLLCVTHDIAETRGFDRVLVIEDGRLIEDGTPASLVARASRYRTLLDEEAALHRDLWEAPDWRRWRLTEGRLIEGEAA